MNEMDIITDFDPNEIEQQFNNKYFRKCAEKLKQSSGLLHLTTSFNKIKENKKLITSAGGLGGVIYTVPVFNEGEIHNLGIHLINDEIDMFLSNQGVENVENGYILIESIEGFKIGFVDYMNWGCHYFDVAAPIDRKELEVKIDIEKQLIMNIVKTIKTVKKLDSQKISHWILKSNILKPIYFETLLICLFERQTSNYNNELQNGNVKKLIFSLNPLLAKNFSLNNFTSTIGSFTPYINIELFFSLLYAKIEKYFIENEDNLKGHVVFRCFNQRQFIEQEFAKRLWNEAENKNINVITYAVPKGEMGVLPIGDFQFSFGDVRCGKFIKNNNIELKIQRKITTKNTIMRNPYVEKGYNSERLE